MQVTLLNTFASAEAPTTHTHIHTHTNKTAKKKVIKKEKKFERQGSYPEYKKHPKQCLSQSSDPAPFFLTDNS